LGIWATLTLANHLALPKLHALRDSKVIIEWLNNRGRFHASAIEGWKHRTKELIKNFKKLASNIYSGISTRRQINYQNKLFMNLMEEFHFTNGIPGAQVP
jgi:hypothetical protein